MNRQTTGCVGKLLRFVSFGLFLLVFNLIGAAQQETGNVRAIVTPLIDRQHRSDWDSQVQLVKQKFIIVLYQNAAAIFSESDFKYLGMDSTSVEFDLPSTGYKTQTASGKDVFNTTLRDPQIWVDGSKTSPGLREDDEVEYYTIAPHFNPGQTKKIKALFWVSLEDRDLDAGSNDSMEIFSGQRTLILRLSEAGIWKDVINNLDVIVRMEDGVVPADSIVHLSPKTYQIQDSTVTWTSTNIGPVESQNIIIRYATNALQQSPLRTLDLLSAYIRDKGYNELLSIHRSIEDD